MIQLDKKDKEAIEREFVDGRDPTEAPAEDEGDAFARLYQDAVKAFRDDHDEKGLTEADVDRLVEQEFGDDKVEDADSPAQPTDTTPLIFRLDPKDVEKARVLGYHGDVVRSAADKIKAELEQDDKYPNHGQSHADKLIHSLFWRFLSDEQERLQKVGAVPVRNLPTAQPKESAGDLVEFAESFRVEFD